MSNVTKRGDTYRIVASAGYDGSGKQIRKSLTWKPSSGMTQKQIEKEIERQAVLFEEKVKSGTNLDGNVKFQDFAERWFKDYAETQLRDKTIQRYNDLSKRTYQAIGNIRLDKIQPQHLSSFYRNLSEPGVKDDIKYKQKKDLRALLAKKKISLEKFCELSGVSSTTLRGACKGLQINKKSMENICRAFNFKEDILFEAVNEGHPLSSRTIKHYHTFISSVLERAVKWGIISSNPCRRIDPPKVEQKPVKYLNEEQAALMLDLLPNESILYCTIFYLLLFTGMRRGELMGLEWKDINFDNKVLSIRRTSQYIKGKGIITDDVKTTSSRRSMKLSDEVIDTLRQYRSWQTGECLKLGDKWNISDRLFTHSDGTPMSPNAPYRWLQSFLKRNNLPIVNVHSLRHTNATLLIKQGVNVRTVSGRLGHSVASTTLNIYSHELQSADAAAADSLSQIINSSRKSATN